MSAVCPSSLGPAAEPASEPDPKAEIPRCRHPRGLQLLCVVVFFERWAAYLLASSMVLMLCLRYGLGRAEALRWVGVFNASTYLLTLAGGFVIERLLSARRALALGMTLLILGYAAMTLPGAPALRVAVTLLLFGHALFKPSTQTVMAGLFRPMDLRLDTAQIRFYLAANVGGTVGALTAGWLARGYDFRALCATAAAAMLCGRATLAALRPALAVRTQPDEQPITGPAGCSKSASQYSARGRYRTLAALLLAMGIYTIAFGQVEGSLLLWAQDRTDRGLLGCEIPAAWFVGLPALLVVLLAPLQLRLMPWLTRRVRSETLIAAGVLALFAAFAVLVPPALQPGRPRVSMVWLCASMSLLVLGELLIAPLSLSLILRLVPPRWVGLCVALWYVAGAAGYGLSGELGAWLLQ